MPSVRFSHPPTQNASFTPIVTPPAPPSTNNKWNKTQVIFTSVVGVVALAALGGCYALYLENQRLRDFLSENLPKIFEAQADKLAKNLCESELKVVSTARGLHLTNEALLTQYRSDLKGCESARKYDDLRLKNRADLEEFLTKSLEKCRSDLTVKFFDCVNKEPEKPVTVLAISENIDVENFGPTPSETYFRNDDADLVS